MNLGNVLSFGFVQGASILRRGFANGFVVKFDTTTRVIVTAGVFEANGRIYVLTADATHTLTSLASAIDFHYIYISSGSVGSTPTFLDSVTEPVYDPVRLGWYNGDDRLVAVIFSPAASATIEFFDSFLINENSIRNTIERKILATNQDPNGAYQTPNISESSVFLPINAIEALIYLQNDDVGSAVELAWRNNEAAILSTNLARAPSFVSGFGKTSTGFWDVLGTSRNIKIGGNDDDDNVLFAAVKGYGYSR